MKVMLDKGAFPPSRAYKTDAGLDLYSPVDVFVPARGSAVIDTGVHVEISVGWAGMLKSKSGLNVHHGIRSEGVIDAGYRGSIRAKLYNSNDVPYHVHAGDKITQLVVVPVMLDDVEIVDRLSDAERGNGGFGSTGR